MKKRSVWLLLSGIWGGAACLWGVFCMLKLMTGSAPGTWGYDIGMFAALLVILPWLLAILLGTIMAFLGRAREKRWMPLLSAIGFFLGFWLLKDWWYLPLPAMVFSLIGFFTFPQKSKE